MGLKNKKEITPEEQLKLDLQLETDLARLQRQHRNLERDRGGYTSGAKMAKQLRLISILDKEQRNVFTDLFVATCSTKKAQDAQLTADMTNLLCENDDFQAKLNEKHAHLKEVDDQIFMMKKEVIAARAKLPGEAEQAKRVLNGQKVLENLENKLDTAVKRFCVIQTENKKLKEEIDHLFIERMNFNKIWESLISNLNKGKKFMLDLIEQATIAYNERDQCVAKLQALRFRAHNDLIMNTQEMQEMQRKIDYDGQLQEFLGVKGQKRNMRDLHEKMMLKKAKKRQEMLDHLNKSKELLVQILDFTEMEDINQFFVGYLKQEESNFGVFNLIVATNKEIETLNQDVVDLHAQIDFQNDMRSQRGEHQTSKLHKYKEDLKKVTAEADDRQKRLDETNGLLQKLYTGIDKLFRICKCSNAPLMELLGDNATINDYNVILHLNMLEGQITDLILNQYHMEKTTRKKDKPQIKYIREDQFAGTVHAMDKIVPTNPCPLCVDQELVSDLIDTLQFVQTKAEVKVKLAFRLTLPGAYDRLHNVSACNLPESRRIIQRRYQ